MEEKPRDGRALIGFMEEQDAVGFLKNNCVPDDAKDETLRSIWSNADAARKALPASDLRPEVLDVESRFKGRLDAVSNDPTFAEVVQGVRWSFKLVEIDKLVCFQKYVDTEYSEEVAKESTLQDIGKRIEFCLTDRPFKRPIQMTYDQAQWAYTVYSPNVDLRLLQPTQIQDPVTKRDAYGFFVGWGSPHVQVAMYKDRYFLKNGYHRVYVLKKNSVKHVPCVLIETDSFEMVGAWQSGFFPEEMLMSERPPLFADFFSDQVAPVVKLRQLLKIVRVKGEGYVIPLTMQPAQPAEAAPMETKEAITETGESQFEDFKIVREDWNAYKLSDDTVVKVRAMLLRLRKQRTADPRIHGLGVETNVVTTTMPPDKVKGEPSTAQYSPQELSSSVVERDMKHQTLQQVTGEYLTKDGVKVLFHPGKLSVSKTSKFNNLGEPIYLVNAQLSVQIIPPGQPTKQ